MCLKQATTKTGSLVIVTLQTIISDSILGRGNKRIQHRTQGEYNETKPTNKTVTESLDRDE